MKAKITVHIYAKTSKANKNGQLPIYFRLTVNGERFEFSTKKSSKTSTNVWFYCLLNRSYDISIRLY